MSTKALIYVIIAGVLVLAGVWLARQAYLDQQLRNERTDHQTTINRNQAGSDAVLEGIRTDAGIDAGAARARTRHREETRDDQDYQAYLARPLPAATRRLYRDVAEETERAARDRGADGAGTAPRQEDR